MKSGTYTGTIIDTNIICNSIFIIGKEYVTAQWFFPYDKNWETRTAIITLVKLRYGNNIDIGDQYITVNINLDSRRELC